MASIIESIRKAVNGYSANGSTQPVSQKIIPLAPEVGVTGLRYSYGQIQEEAHRRLKTRRYYFQDLKEMRYNDAVVSGCLWPIEMILRSVKWDVEPASESNQDQADAEFVRNAAFEDMSHSWSSFMAEYAKIFTFGFKPFEICYKQRRGPEQTDPQYRSIYNDGLYGWRKFAPRDPETVDEWIFGEDGGVDGMLQCDPNDYGQKSLPPVPITKLLLFTTTSDKNSPEGLSLLRGAYVPWYFKKHIQEMEAIAIERDATGYPILYVPPALWAAGKEAELSGWVSKVIAIRKDEQQGMVLPSEYDENGNALWQLKTIESSGQALDTRKVIEGLNLEIALAMMSAWILLGHQAIGSKALSEDHSQTSMVALRGWLESLADVLNRHAIPRLFFINGWRGREKFPKFKPGDIRPADVAGLSNILKNLAQAGFPIGTEASILNYTLKQAGMPEVDEESFAESMAQRVVPGFAPMDEDENATGTRSQPQGAPNGGVEATQ